MAKVYPHLPGIRVILNDQGLTFTPEEDLRTSILILGTATDGPQGEPVQVFNPESALDEYGGLESAVRGTLLKGMYEVLSTAPADADIRLMRIGNGKKASLTISSNEVLQEKFVGNGRGLRLQVKNIIGDLKSNDCHVYQSDDNEPSGFKEIKHLCTYEDDIIYLPDVAPTGTVYLVHYRPMSLELMAANPGRIYNQVTFRRSEGVDFAGVPTVRIYNPKSGNNSDFQLDMTADASDIYNIKDVNDLVDAINNDTNLTGVVSARTQTITATDVFRINNATESVELGIGGIINLDNIPPVVKTVREYILANSPLGLNVPFGTLPPIDSNKQVYTSDVSSPASTGLSAITVKSIKRIDAATAVANGLVVGGNIDYTANLANAFDNVSEEDLSNYVVGYDPESDNVSNPNPSNSTMTGTYYIDGTPIQTGDLFLVEYEAEVLSYDTVYGVGLTTGSGADLTDLTEGRTGTGGANKVSALTKVHEIRTRTRKRIPAGVRELDLGELVVSEDGADKIISARRRRTYLNQHIGSPITINITDLAPGVANSDVNVVYVRNETKGLNFSTNTADPLHFTYEVTGSAPNVTVSITLPDNDSFVVPSDNITVVLDYSAQLTQGINAGSLADDTEYFIAGPIISFGGVTTSEILIDYKYKYEYKINSDVEITDETDAVITFIGQTIPGDNLDPNDSSSYNTLVVEYEYLPELPSGDSVGEIAATPLKGGSDGTVMNNDELYKALEDAYALLENYNVDIIVPKGVYIDSTVTRYNTVTGKEYKENAGFHKQLENHLEIVSQNSNETIGVMSIMPPSSTSLSDVKTWYENATIVRNYATTSAANVMAATNAPRLDMRYISPLALPTMRFSSGVLGTWEATAEAAYAGLIATLPVYEGTTGQPLPGAVTPLFSLSNTQRNELTKMRLVTAEVIDNTAYIVRGMTGAYYRTTFYPDGRIKAYDQSDYTNLSTVRIVNSILSDIRSIARPFLGKPNSAENREALNTAIKSKLSTYIPNGLEFFDIQIVVTPNQRVLGEATIKLLLKPNLELQRIIVDASLQ